MPIDHATAACGVSRDGGDWALGNGFARGYGYMGAAGYYRSRHDRGYWHLDFSNAVAFDSSIGQCPTAREMDRMGGDGDSAECRRPTLSKQR